MMNEHRLTRSTPSKDQLIFDYLPLERTALYEYYLEQISCEYLLFETERVLLAHAPVAMTIGYLTELLSLLVQRRDVLIELDALSWILAETVTPIENPENDSQSEKPIAKRVDEAQSFYRMMAPREALAERIRYAAVVENTSEVEHALRETGTATASALANFASVRISSVVQLLAIDGVRDELAAL